MRVLLASCLSLALLSSTALAQDGRFWVQIEAHPDVATAEARAEAYDGLLDDVTGFALSGRWHALALGPYGQDEALATLRTLRADGLIPRDSYVSDGATYRDRFWPPEGAPVPVASATAVAAEPVAPPAVAAAPESLPEARASEAALDREAKQDLQRALAWFGYYTAGIDGSFGGGTRTSMAAWQRDAGDEPTGVLTTVQRRDLILAWRENQARLGLGPIESAEAGVALTGPLGLVTFDRIEAPFVHYAPKDGSGVRLSLISQGGDAATLGGLYEILQTLDVVPTEGPRSKQADGFSIRGEADGRTTQVRALLRDGHVFGYILSWPLEQDAAAVRATRLMDETMRSIGTPLAASAGYDPEAQRFDMISGLQVRQPRRAASGFFVDGAGRVATAAATVEGCGRITLDRLHDARVVARGGPVAVLEPVDALAPMVTARLAPAPGRLRAPVSVGGFPYGGVLGAATLSFGTLEDVRGLDGEADVMRLSLEAQAGDVGGPVLDEAGRVAGMLLPAAADTATRLPGDVAFAAKPSALRAALSAAGVDPATDETASVLAPEDLTRRAAGMTVLVSCWE